MNGRFAAGPAHASIRKVNPLNDALAARKIDVPTAAALREAMAQIRRENLPVAECDAHVEHLERAALDPQTNRAEPTPITSADGIVIGPEIDHSLTKRDPSLVRCRKRLTSLRGGRRRRSGLVPGNRALRPNRAPGGDEKRRDDDQTKDSTSIHE